MKTLTFHFLVQSFLSVLVILGAAPMAQAYMRGITGWSGNPLTTGGNHCSVCHGGSVTPTVTLSGPPTVNAGSTVPLILRVSGTYNIVSGLNVSASGGDFRPGADTQLVNGEITHLAPVPAVNGIVDFAFTWTAPATPGPVTLYGAGLSADGNGVNGNDADNVTSVQIMVVPNQAPVANAGGPYAAQGGMDIIFDGTGSRDADGTIVTYAWDFGDGAAGTGARPTHAYAAMGTYTVTLTVTDGAGLSATATTTATILSPLNSAPVANAGGPYWLKRKKCIQFDGSGSRDADGRIVSYSWDFGDGSTGTGPAPRHHYRSTGTFRVTLTVTDDDGAQSTAVTTITISR